MQSLPIRVTPAEWAILQAAFAKVFNGLAGVTVWAFGSRTGHQSALVVKPFSDLDLIVESDLPLPQGTLAQLRDVLTESDLPWKVDVLDAKETSAAFKKMIGSSYVNVFES